jgi:hypothetical protein
VELLKKSAPDLDEPLEFRNTTVEAVRKVFLMFLGWKASLQGGYPSYRSFDEAARTDFQRGETIST